MRKRHQKGRSFSIRTGVTPTKERRRQNGGVRAEVIDRDYHGTILVKRYRAVWECPLDAYLDYRVISELEHKAGLLFRGAYLSAILSRRTAYERLDRNYAYQDPVQSERMLKEAYRTLSSHYTGAIIDICGHDLPARDMAKLDRLKKGLGQLAAIWRATAREVFDRC